MYKLIYPNKDTTLYQRHPNRNTGVDQILELTKITSGSAVEDLIGQYEYWGETLNTRILMDFDLTTISASIVTDSISNPTFYVNMKATDAVSLPITYTVMAYAVSGSWTNGTGYYNNDREVTNGASWNYRHSESDGRSWSVLGGDYYSSSLYTASQSFNYENPDIRMNVTSIMSQWLSGSISNNGLLFKFTTDSENNSDVLGSIKFFSKDTHTIYVPRLEMFWNSVDVSGTGSISVVDLTNDYTVYINNLKDTYLEGEYAKFRIGVRPSFPTLSYTTTNAYLTTYRLPITTYFKIVDSVTDEDIVPYHEDGTKLNCDSAGNYLYVDTNSFLPVRYYKIVFKVVNGSEVKYIDNNFSFKVGR